MAPNRRTLTILGTSDLHGHIYPWNYFSAAPGPGGLARLATIVRRERAANPLTLLVDNGDAIQGTPLTYLFTVLDHSQPHPVAAAMNQLGYAAMALGNHEFNFGQPALDRFIGQARFPVLSANIRRSDHGERFQPCALLKAGPLKVGVVGLTTPCIPSWEQAGHLDGLRFDPPIGWARHYAAQLRRQGADVVLALLHASFDRAPEAALGPAGWLSDPAGWIDTGSLPGENPALELAGEVGEIDAILCGHTHVDIPSAWVNGALIVQPGAWGRQLAKITIELERHPEGSGPRRRWQVVAKRGELLSADDAEPDPQMLDAVRRQHEATLAYIESPIGATSHAFPGGPRARYQPGDLPALINTVQLEAARAAGFAPDISLCAVFNDAGQLPAGPVRLRDAYSMYIYDGTIYVLEITGAILRRALEHNARYFRQLDPAALPADPKGVVQPNLHDYNWDIYAGIDYAYDLTQPAGRRLAELRFQGREVRDGDRFVAALNNYRAVGGGGFAMFREGVTLWQSETEVRELLVDYLRRHPGLDGAGLAQSGQQLFPDLHRHYFGATASR
ncbi:MAG TPA: 5'-nucleotidase C-terminal domain-containing protein [Herpetosiphonaceae bacterium]